MSHALVVELQVPFPPTAQAIALAARKRVAQPVREPVCVHAWLYLPIAPDIARARREDMRQGRERPRDVEYSVGVLTFLVGSALVGPVLADYDLIAESHVARHWGEDPRLEVRVVTL